MKPVFDEKSLELRTLGEEALVLLRRAEAHDMLDARAVVPAAVEENDLTARRHVLDVALEVPLGALSLGRRRQCDDAAVARVEPLGDPLDRSALPRGVTTFEHDRDPDSLRPNPVEHAR